MTGIIASADAIFAITDEAPPSVNPNDTAKNILNRSHKLVELLSHDKLGRLYAGWKDHPYARGGWGAWKYGDGDEEKQLPKLETMNFGHMYDGYGRMAKMGQVGSELITAMNATQTGIGQVWQGPAATAAGKKFTEVMNGATAFQDSNARLSGAMMGLWQNTREAVTELADFAEGGQRGANFISIYGPVEDLNDKAYKIGGLNDIVGRGFPTLQSIIDKANEDDEFAIDLAFDHVGPFPAGLRLWKEISETVSWLNDLASQYNEVVTQWRERIKACVDAVKADFETFNESVNTLNTVGKAGEGSPTDPFAKIAPPKPVNDPGDQPGNTPGKTPDDKDGNQPGNKSGGGGGGGNPGGGGGGGGGGPKPEIKMPEPLKVDAVPDPGATTPAGAIDPATGLPIDPATGQPVKPQTAETVTIKNGANEIAVSSPDGAGKVKVTVDDGTGKPKTYEMDFGAGGSGGAGGVPGQPGLPGQSGVGGGATAFGPDGRPVAAGGAQDLAQQVMAGPDGKAVISEGDLTITAEMAPGSSDTILVTVDGGTGEPITYTLDFDDAPEGTVMGGSAGTDPAGSAGQGQGHGQGQGQAFAQAERVPGANGPQQGFVQAEAAPVYAPGDGAQATFAASTGGLGTEGGGQWGAPGAFIADDAQPGPQENVQAAGSGEAGLASAGG
ncbi:MAG: hypothetical protein ACRDSQ_00540, partial [Actinokineospora sp.]